MAKYVRQNRREKFKRAKQKKDIQETQLTEQRKPTAKPTETPPRPSNEKLLKELRTEFEAISETARLVLTNAKEAYSKSIEQHTLKKLTELKTNVETLIARVPKEETTLVNALENYRNSIQNFLSTTREEAFIETWQNDFADLRNDIRAFITDTFEQHTKLIQRAQKLSTQLPDDEHEFKSVIADYEKFLANVMPSVSEEENLQAFSKPRLGG